MIYTKLSLEQLNNLYNEFNMNETEQSQLLNALHVNNQYKYKPPESGGNKYHRVAALRLLMAENHQFSPQVELYRKVEEELQARNIYCRQEPFESHFSQALRDEGLLVKGYGFIRLTKVGQVFFALIFPGYTPEYLRKVVRKAIELPQENKMEEAKVTYPYLLDVLSPKYIEVIEKYINEKVKEAVEEKTERLQTIIHEYETIFELVVETINDR